MQWTFYFWNIVQSYKVVVVGWPEECIPFANLSSISSSLPDLKVILQKWEMGSIYWEEITDIQLEQLCLENSLWIECGEIMEPIQHTHSDKGSKHVHSQENSEGAQCGGKKHKSSEIVMDEDNNEPNNIPQPCIPPYSSNTLSDTGAVAITSGLSNTSAASISSTAPATPTTPDDSLAASSNASTNDGLDVTNSLADQVAALTAAQVDDLCANILHNIDSFDFTSTEDSFFNTLAQ